jgi:hypothetical protein
MKKEVVLRALGETHIPIVNSLGIEENIGGPETFKPFPVLSNSKWLV